MPRTSSNPRVINRTVRAKLAVRRDPYWHLIAEGKHLGYRKGANGGTWIARLYSPEQGRRFKSVGAADDTAQANDSDVLSFPQAIIKAQEWFDLETRLERGEIQRGVTVADACHAYMKDRKRNSGLAERLIQDQATIDAYILPELGKIKLNDLTHGRVRAWRDTRADAKKRLRSRTGQEQAFGEETVSKATVNKNLTVLKAILNYAKTEMRAVESDTAWVDVKLFKGADQPKVRFLSNVELKAFLPQCAPDFRKLVLGALGTAARYGELTRLQVGDFSESNMSVYIAPSKNGEERYVHLEPSAVEFFKSMTQGRNAKELIFLRENGNPWKKSEQKRPMDAACGGSNVKDVTFHILRHTYASHAIMGGMRLEILKEQLGHKTLAITIKHYAHLCPDYKKQAVIAHAPRFDFEAKNELQLA